MNNTEIREAKESEHEILTEISFASKKYWDYPAKYIDIWKDELTITERYTKENIVIVVEIDKRVVGYYSVVDLPEDIELLGIKICKGFWLEHMFLLPEFIGQGYGTAMVSHMKEYCLSNKIPKVSVLADPNAKAFYEKKGFKYIKEYPSTISGRTGC